MSRVSFSNITDHLELLFSFCFELFYAKAEKRYINNSTLKVTPADISVSASSDLR